MHIKHIQTQSTCLLKHLLFTSYHLITVLSLSGAFHWHISCLNLFNSTEHIHCLPISLFLLLLSVFGSSFGLYLPLTCLSSPPHRQTHHHPCYPHQSQSNHQLRAAAAASGLHVEPSKLLTFYFHFYFISLPVLS